MKPIVRLQFAAHSLIAPLGYHATPSFIGIGVPKAGTTSFQHYLLQHPDIRGSQTKELDFFDKHYARGENWYWSKFALPIPGRFSLTGEFSVSYYDTPGVPERIAECLPDVKLILLLRNPTERAFSHYNMNAGRADTLEFDQIVDRELKRLEIVGPHWLDKLDDPVAHLPTAYVTRGLYAQAIQRWFKVFPRENFAIIKFEQMVADPARSVADTLRFLGVDPARYPPDKEYKKYFAGDYHSVMTRETRERLQAFYRPHNQVLVDLLGWDVADWDAPA